jgi:iron complex transport system ATP-binding protein
VAAVTEYQGASSRVPLIEIRDATVYRGSTRVFHHFTLSIEQGCNTVVLGPNGAGKTTLLKILTRDLYPVVRQGTSIRILGDERSDIWSLRSKFGIVSSDLQYEYSGSARAIEVVLSGFYASLGVWGHQEFSVGERQRAERILCELSMESLAEQRYGVLSTGQQRRLLLGRALVTNPSNLLLDEPTSGLDLSATFQYLKNMRQLMCDGRTLVLVTHHIHEIPPEIRRVVLLKEGEIFMDGAKESVLTRKNLTELYGEPARVVEAEGWYQVLPG